MRNIITGVLLSLMSTVGWGEDADLKLLFLRLKH
jgi:hypothetical protein